MAEALDLALGQPRAWAEGLRKAAPMRDIGKIGIPDSVLKKPDRFTFEVRRILNRHPQIGAAILGQSRSPWFQLAAEVALTHPERFDGGGYPNRLAGEAIALGGRIVSVVDLFDALTLRRCYRPAMPDAKVKNSLMTERV